MLKIEEMYVGRPWNAKRHLPMTETVDGLQVCELLDPHPDYVWLDESGNEHSIGTSLFVGPNLPRLQFNSKCPLYVPESVKWNRYLYYSMPDPRLFDSLSEASKEGILDCLTLSLDDSGGLCCNVSFMESATEKWAEVFHSPGVWSLWGRCCEHRLSPKKCLDVHECVDIGYELSMHHQMLEEARVHEWHDGYFDNGDVQSVTVMFGKHYGPWTTFSMERRSKAISNWYDLEVRLVALELDNKFLRELVEAQFAWENKSVYWNRSYFQPVTQRMVLSQVEKQLHKNKEVQLNGH